MKILVTGGAGYIGSHTVKELLKQKHEVIIIDNLENGTKRAVIGGKFYQADLRDLNQLEKIFNNNKIEAVVHFAAYASVPDSVSDPAKYFENNVSGGLNLLSVMRKFNVDKIVFSSSAAVYGQPKKSPVDEDEEKKPTNPYGLTKWQFEEILRTYNKAYGLKSVSLRYFCAAGADPDGQIGENHRPETHVIPMAILSALGKREQFKIFGDNYQTPDDTGVRDFIHVSDLARIHVLALDYLAKGGKTDYFNCGINKGYSVKEIASKVKEISGRDFKVNIEVRRPGDPAELIANADKIKKFLGFEAQHSDLDTIIKTAWNWLEKHPELN